MADDKGKDDGLFNCGEKHEIDYVVKLYPDDRADEVRKAILAGCKNGMLNRATRTTLYKYIEKVTGLPVPVTPKK